MPYQQDAQGRQVWAVFTQVNVPIFSEQNALPVLRRVDLEFSWRHDQYSDVQGTSNPKVAFNWAPIEDLTIRGTWGTSFRAPVFGELSPLANVAIAGQNLGEFCATRPTDSRSAGCAGGDLPPVGSGAWKVHELGRRRHAGQRDRLPDRASSAGGLIPTPATAGHLA